MAGDIDFLPFDIIFHILLWLPVSSLLRFKSVCKSWLSLVESSDFVDKHTHFASLNDCEQQIKLLILNSPQQISLFSVDNKSEVLLDFPPIDDPFQLNSAKMVASCNGIICLQQDRRLCLWNPATKQCTNLPPLPVFSCPIVSSIGFGFDSKANDFKLVTSNFINGCYPIHIYSLRSDSWRAFEGFGIPDVLLESGMKAPYRDRIYCWLRGGVDAVSTFDFSDEVFGNIPLPTSIYTSTLFILMDNIACVGSVKNEVDVQSGYYEIWMLNDYQVKDSWTKLYSIECICKSFQWMTWFSDNGDFLLFLGGEQLCLYDLLTHGVMNLPVHTRRYCDVVVYRETLFSIKRGNETANGVTSDCNRRMLINQLITGNNSCGDSDVHKDAIYHILLWLPVVSLQRFKSVCKSWHSLIKSSDFVAQHLFLHHHQHKLDNLNLVLFSPNISCYPLFADPSHHSPNASGTCLLSAGKLELLDLPIYEYWGYGCLYIATSFNGIICLKHSDYDYVFLWNPVTKQFKVLHPGRLSNDAEKKSHVGFGFDVKTNDYKLVIFCGGVDSVVPVYSLSTDSWRIIHDEVLSSVKNIHSGLDAPYRDEIYCWLAEIDDTMCVLSFDFSNEVFGTVVALPNSINASSLIHVLIVSRDKIACISLGEEYHSDDMENWHCEIWMMNEYGVKESWVKLYTVGPFSKDWRFEMYYSKKKKNGDYILLLKDGQLHEYDLGTRETERLPFQIEGPEHYQVVAYEESLVPIKSGYCYLT